MEVKLFKVCYRSYFMKKEELEARSKYNLMAKDYHDLRTKKNPEGWFYNELLEMPATISLLENVKGKKILDFGCGTGIYARLLAKKGAIVKGFDISPEMIRIAKKENPSLDLRVGSGYNIPFKEKFDIVIAPLVLDYLVDWEKVFKKVYSLLNKGGDFIFSIGNPVSECVEKLEFGGRRYRVLGISDYFKEGKHYSSWNFDKYKIDIPGYHKTYESIINLILNTGFEITGYKDAFPLKGGKKLEPKEYEHTSKIPYFCVWKVRKK